MRLTTILCSIICLAITAYAQAPKSTPGQFNVECPASHLCPDLEKYYQACRLSHESESCPAFVAAFRKLTSKYDCQRSFDHTSTADYVVSAVWLCDEILGIHHERALLEEYIDLLRELKSDDARCFFASAEFRNILDGYLAEEFLEESLRAGKKASELNCPSVGAIENAN